MELVALFLDGLNRVVRSKRMWALLFAIQLIISLMLVLPLRGQWDAMLGHSLAGESMVQGNGVNLIFEFLVQRSHAVHIEQNLVLLGALFYLVLTIFLNGGILGVFTSDEGDFKIGPFFNSAGAYFGRFLRLFLLSLICFGAALLIHGGLSALLKAIAGDSEPAMVILKIAGWIFLLLLFLLINMAFDYARIITVLTDQRKMVRAVMSAWVFVFRHVGQTTGLYGLVTLAGLILFGLYHAVGSFIATSTGLGIITLFLWQQIHAIGRVGVRLLYFSSQTNLYRNTSEEPLLKAWFNRPSSTSGSPEPPVQG